MTLSLASYVFTYLLGGLTFIPLVVASVLLHIHWTQPALESDASLPRDGLELSAGEKQADAKEREKLLPTGISQRAHDSDHAASYFVVCRDYTPAVMLGKPVERTWSNGSAASPASSPSVYQTMYRSIFERGKTSSPSLDPAAKPNKRNRNSFFIVIR
jgi:hypothetical protein